MCRAGDGFLSMVREEWADTGRPCPFVESNVFLWLVTEHGKQGSYLNVSITWPFWPFPRHSSWVLMSGARLWWPGFGANSYGEAPKPPRQKTAATRPFLSGARPLPQKQDTTPDGKVHRAKATFKECISRSCDLFPHAPPRLPATRSAWVTRNADPVSAPTAIYLTLVLWRGIRTATEPIISSTAPPSKSRVSYFPTCPTMLPTRLTTTTRSMSGQNSHIFARLWPSITSCVAACHMPLKPQTRATRCPS